MQYIYLPSYTVAGVRQVRSKSVPLGGSQDIRCMVHYTTYTKG